MSMNPLIFFTAIIWFCLQVSPAFAERYRVTEDNFGNFAAEKVEESVSEKEIEKEINETEEPEALPPSSTVESHNKRIFFKSSFGDNEESTPSEVSERVNESAEPLEELTEEEKSALNRNAEPESEPEEKKLSIFEQKFLEAEAKEKEEALQRLRNRAGQNAYDATRVDEAEFVDGDLLLEGKASSEDKQPYFVTLDADGQQRVTFYSPELIKRALEEKYSSSKVEKTPATIYRREDSVAKSAGNPDPQALSILGLSENPAFDYFSDFERRCCQRIPNRYIPLVDTGRTNYFELEKEDLSYRFPHGDSRYLLVRLPKRDAHYLLRLRTFIREFSKQGIEHGVFFPHIVTLDSEKRPLRIIADPLFHFEPETWTRYGFLEGVFEIESSLEEGERFLLVSTTPDYLRRVSVFESDEESVEIRHMDTGSFQVDILEEDES